VERGEVGVEGSLTTRLIIMTSGKDISHYVAHCHGSIMFIPNTKRNVKSVQFVEKKSIPKPKFLNKPR
jgi:hypothetical protein